MRIDPAEVEFARDQEDDRSNCRQSTIAASLRRSTRYCQARAVRFVVKKACQVRAARRWRG